MGRRRALDWPALLNARDLGGLRAPGGSETRWGAVVRSDSLAALTARGRDAVIRYGIRTVIDLRLPQEVEREPNPFAAPDGHGVAYRNVSFIDPAATPPAERTTLAGDYTGMLERFPTQVASVITAVARAERGGVVIHCAAGKDRTGLVAALLLTVAGVAPEAIAEDYALTTEALRPREAQWLADGPGDRAEREAALLWSRALPEVMQEVLADTVARYGAVEDYLLRAGVDAADIVRVRARLVDP
jgi:protein-tyrosine phosphatase